MTKPFIAIAVLVLLPMLSGLALAESDAKSENPEARLPLEDLQLFVQVFDQIRNAYVEKVDDKQMFENAIKGMLAGLDPHSTYLDESSFDELQESTTGEFGGLGLEVGMEGGFIRVVAPIDDTPAYRAGIQTGDLIIKLDDKAVQGMSLREAIDLMRGPKGASITITLLREGIDAPMEITIERDIIRVRSIRSEVLEEGFGYLRIAQFQVDTGKQFRKELANLRKTAKPLRGIILDLRNNPGGLLPASIEVADTVLDDGLIVYTEGRIPSANVKFRATKGDVLNGLPIVTIINNGSASASEIVAGALQDNHRSIIVGTQSFGKGSVQTVLPLNDGKAIKLTTARYFTPSGRSIQAEGIHPDIEVALAQIKVLEHSQSISEANLAGHLENNTDKKASVSRLKARDNLADDNQLYEALNILKGIAIFNNDR